MRWVSKRPLLASASPSAFADPSRSTKLLYTSTIYIYRNDHDGFSLFQFNFQIILPLLMLALILAFSLPLGLPLFVFLVA